jgi:hypothetical protein
MHFEVKTTGGNTCCRWIQATGDISQDTATDFERFSKTTEFVPDVVRLNSPGGSLIGGIKLGELFRELRLSTEVGSSKPVPTAVSPNVSSPAPGICASACAYAFIGGEERTLDLDAKLGFHRFYSKEALASSTNKIFSGQDLDDTQKIAAALLLYVVNMGVDARLLALASQAGPNEIKWLTLQEARDLRVVYEPSTYKSWRIEPYNNGAIAVSESNDGLRSVVAGCSVKTGPYVALIDPEPQVTESWLEQCVPMGTIDAHVHPVFGTIVQPSQVSWSHYKKSGFIIRFQLPSRNPPLTSPNLLTFDLGYSHACSTGMYQASTENFLPAVRLALRNCHN